MSDLMTQFAVEAGQVWNYKDDASALVEVLGTGDVDMFVSGVAIKHKIGGILALMELGYFVEHLERVDSVPIGGG